MKLTAVAGVPVEAVVVEFVVAVHIVVAKMSLLLYSVEVTEDFSDSV